MRNPKSDVLLVNTGMYIYNNVHIIVTLEVYLGKEHSEKKILGLIDQSISGLKN